jgi:hypothetical protein
MKAHRLFSRVTGAPGSSLPAALFQCRVAGPHPPSPGTPVTVSAGFLPALLDGHGDLHLGHEQRNAMDQGARPLSELGSCFGTKSAKLIKLDGWRHLVGPALGTIDPEDHSLPAALARRRASQSRALAEEASVGAEWHLHPRVDARQPTAPRGTATLFFDEDGLGGLDQVTRRSSSQSLVLLSSCVPGGGLPPPRPALAFSDPDAHQHGGPADRGCEGDVAGRGRRRCRSRRRTRGQAASGSQPQPPLQLSGSCLAVCRERRSGRSRVRLGRRAGARSPCHRSQ